MTPPVIGAMRVLSKRASVISTIPSAATNTMAAAGVGGR